jgi:hypothetical protein
MTLRLRGRFNDASAAGLANALQVYDKDIQCVEFDSPGLSGASMGVVLTAAVSRGAIAYSFRDCAIQETVIRDLKRAMNSRNTPEAVANVVLPRSLEIINCKVDFARFGSIFQDVMHPIVVPERDAQAVREMSPS